MPTKNLQIAMASLVAAMFTLWLGVAVGLEKLHPTPEMIVSVNGVIITIGLFSLPLMWWRTKLGYVGAMIVGIINVLGNIAGMAMILSNSPEMQNMPREYPFIVIPFQSLFSLLAIIYSVKTWKEKV